ncbi:Lipoyltransferase 1, mitochondrial [Aphelenchoides besseyi]|nr:Lipoyltransferase 1, mitochondrial [Aphelenchoides besseyi]
MMARVSKIKVFVSQSSCIFQNLAFEEWLFRHHDLDRFAQAILLWSNTPSVVIGRHQNPWMEADVEFVRDRGINLVRRYSGGGTVYHDLGNLNVSILTSQKRHDRPKNLMNIAGWLNRHFNVQIEANKRDDLLLQPGDRKVSGTAARIARGRAYHHLTLLVNPDLQTLRRSIRSPFHTEIKTNATRSTRAKAVGQLIDENANARVEQLISVIINGFNELAEEIEVVEIKEIEKEVEEEAKTAIRKTVKELKSDEWTFGKSPRFQISLPNTNGDSRVVDVENGVVVASENSLYKTGSKFYPINRLP